MKTTKTNNPLSYNEFDKIVCGLVEQVDEIDNMREDGLYDSNFKFALLNFESNIVEMTSYGTATTSLHNYGNTICLQDEGEKDIKYSFNRNEIEALDRINNEIDSYANRKNLEIEVIEFVDSSTLFVQFVNETLTKWEAWNYHLDYW